MPERALLEGHPRDGLWRAAPGGLRAAHVRRCRPPPTHRPPTNGVDSLPPYTHPPINPSSIRASTCMSVHLCRYGNGTRILAYGQSMGGDCFLTGMLYLVRVRVAASSAACYTWLGLGWLLPHRYVILWLRLGWLLPHRCTRTHARMYHAFVGRTRMRADACAHVTSSVCVCRTCVHGAGPRLGRMPGRTPPARAGLGLSRAWPQQALASPGLGFERRLSAAVLDRACPDWKRPHSQATAWCMNRCMARCMARRSQGAGWSQGEGGALEAPWVSQLVGTAKVRVKRVAAGGTHRSREGTWPTPVHLTCARGPDLPSSSSRGTRWARVPRARRSTLATARAKCPR